MVVCRFMNKGTLLSAFGLTVFIALTVALPGCSSPKTESDTARMVRKNQEILDKIHKDIEESRLAKEREWEKRCTEYLDSHKDLEPEIRESILHKKVMIGMTIEQVEVSWSQPPERKNVTVGSFGRHEQWVYDSTYLYFENGVL